MKNRRGYNPEKSLIQHETTQLKRVKQAFSLEPISLKMISKHTGIMYESICWRSWELHNRDEIYCVGKSICSVTKRQSKFYTTKN